MYRGSPFGGANSHCRGTAASSCANAARAVGDQRRAWAKLPIRQCVTDMVSLARFEHRARTCTATVVKDDGTTAAIDYSCGGAGFGHSQIDVLTPPIASDQHAGHLGGLPFNYVLQARRIDDCRKPQSRRAIKASFNHLMLAREGAGFGTLSSQSGSDARYLGRQSQDRRPFFISPRASSGRI